MSWWASMLISETNQWTEAQPHVTLDTIRPGVSVYTWPRCVASQVQPHWYHLTYNTDEFDWIVLLNWSALIRIQLLLIDLKDYKHSWWFKQYLNTSLTQVQKQQCTCISLKLLMMWKSHSSFCLHMPAGVIKLILK